MSRSSLGVAALLLLGTFAAPARAHVASDLRMVVVLTRHGVRSPTHPGELDAYSARPWPAWSVHGGYLTSRGATLMRLFGAHYRALYETMPGLAGRCPARGTVYLYADVDERTRATGAALAQGFAPGCALTVHSSPDNPDSLFDPLTPQSHIDAAQSRAAVEGMIGGDPAALAVAYSAQLALLDRVLGCTGTSHCTPVSGLASTITPTGDGGTYEISGGLDVAATAAENLLLEYADGKPDVGWGRVDERQLVELLQLHELKERIEHGNYYTARAHSSNVTAHILATLEQGASERRDPQTIVPLSSRFVFIVGHDTQLSEIGGLLHLSWILRGYGMNATPPGSALVFELHAPARAAPYVRLFFTAQSMDEMRSGRGDRPARVPVYVPGCPSLECPLSTLAGIVRRAIDPAFVLPWHAYSSPSK